MGVGKKGLGLAALAAVCTACATAGGTPRPFPRAGGASRPPLSRTLPGVGTVDGYALSGTALGLRGAPYRNGGSDPSGFDCSGFVQYVFSQHGLSLPRTVGELFGLGRPVEPATIEAGDLLFFTTIAPGASHVGIALGGDEFVHAPSTRGEVRVERMSASYWATRFLAARRMR